jgi:predicted regulator of Ras-like GTPase activity (Roadblock/LC7/MglB family)
MSSRIQDAVAELHRLPGVKGAAVVTADGLIAASSFDAGFVGDVVAGLTSYLQMTTNRCLEAGGLGPCAHLVMHATHGKATFTRLEDSCLVVLFDQFADPGQSRREIQEAAQRIRRASRIS